MDNIELQRSLKLVEKTNFLNKEISYLKNVKITEYDITQAGFTVIKFCKLLPEEEIKEIEKMSKTKRNIYLGNRMKDIPGLAETTLKTIEKARKGFVVLNKISADSILSIKKDALFIIKEQAYNLDVKDFKFRVENVFTSYAHLSGIEFYYDGFNDVIVPKGIQKDVVSSISGPLNQLKIFFKQAEKLTPDMLYNSMKRFISKYLSRELPLETYREILTGKYRYGKYLLDEISEDMVKNLDISQNYLKFYLPLIQNII